MAHKAAHPGLALAAVLAVAVLASAVACGRPVPETTPVSAQSFQLDTLITITLYDGDRSDIQDAFDEISRLESLLSAATEGSDLDRLARNAGKDYVDVAEDTLFLFEEGAKFSAMSEGAFDCTVGPLVSLWGIGESGGHYPSDAELADALSLVDYRELSIREGGLAMLAKDGMKADLGAIAKGYIADKVKELLAAKGVKSAVLDLGGNIVLIGNKPDGSAFRIGVRDPAAGAADYFAVFEVADVSLVSSGAYERFFVHEGKAYHHILDVHTGFPADNELLQVTVLSDASYLGDGYSTVAYLLGLDRGLALIEAAEGVEGVFVTRDKKVYVSAGIGDAFVIVSDEYQYGGPIP